MIRTKCLLPVFSLLAWLTIAAIPASAEWFADFHVGPAFTQSEDVNTNTAGIKIKLKNVDFDNSASYGGRFGHWFQAWPYLGLALDVSHFRPNVSRQTVTATALGVSIPGFPLASIDAQVTEISFDAMLRYPLLPTKEIPNGQLQPYFTLGPGIFIARAKDSTNFAPPSHQSKTDTSAGVKVGTGVAWLFQRNVGLFGEYRFTHFSPDFTFTTTGIGRTKVETDVNTHRVIFGISYRF